MAHDHLKKIHFLFCYAEVIGIYSGGLTGTFDVKEQSCLIYHIQMAILFEEM